MKRLLALLISFGALLIYPAVSGASGHTLIVDGHSYDSTHEAGQVIQWETPDTNPSSASFAERSQTWLPGDNGSDHLPCPYGIHWVSNENVLTISHCLEAPSSTTDPTTTSSTTTTSPPTSTTTPSTSTTAPPSTDVSSTTAPETTPSTSSPTTSSEPSSTTSVPDQPSTTQPTTSSTSPPSTSPATTSPSPTSTIPVNPLTPPLPPTGSNGLLAVYAAALLILGAVAIAVTRRRV